MEFVGISGTPLKTSRIGLGTWAIGGWLWGGSDEAESIETIQASMDLGINLIDTAPIYGFGRSEEIVGKALSLSKRRSEVIIATKAGLEWKNGDIRRNSARSRIMKEVEGSLKRLVTDYIDIYQIHWPDNLVPFEETARAMEDLYKEGKIRAIGVSNYSPHQMELFQQAAPLHTSQPPYNLFERKIEDDVLPYCEKKKVSTLCYGVLCRGLLSGRMRADTKFEGDDVRKMDPKFQLPLFEEYLGAIKALDRYSKNRYGKNVLSLAIRWALDQPGVSVVLWGARNPKQLEPIKELIDFSLEEKDFKMIDHILGENISKPIGPEFMAPPLNSKSHGNSK